MKKCLCIKKDHFFKLFRVYNYVDGETVPNFWGANAKVVFGIKGNIIIQEKDFNKQFIPILWWWNKC